MKKKKPREKEHRFNRKGWRGPPARETNPQFFRKTHPAKTTDSKKAKNEKKGGGTNRGCNTGGIDSQRNAGCSVGGLTENGSQKRRGAWDE